MLQNITADAAQAVAPVAVTPAMLMTRGALTIFGFSGLAHHAGNAGVCE